MWCATSATGNFMDVIPLCLPINKRQLWSLTQRSFISIQLITFTWTLRVAALLRLSSGTSVQRNRAILRNVNTKLSCVLTFLRMAWVQVEICSVHVQVKNEYQENFLGVNAAGAYGWQPYQLSVRLLWNLGTLTSWNPLGHSRPVTGLM